MRYLLRIQMEDAKTLGSPWTNHDRIRQDVYGAIYRTKVHDMAGVALLSLLVH